ncbi:MAG: hypothetical protein EXR77_11880 [Myxococcales bacterium]|nr:hypothetical protein [Myxococcales bacterium]
MRRLWSWQTAMLLATAVVFLPRAVFATDGVPRDGVARDGVARDGVARNDLARDDLTTDDNSRLTVAVGVIETPETVPWRIRFGPGVQQVDSDDYNQVAQLWGYTGFTVAWQGRADVLAPLSQRVRVGARGGVAWSNGGQVNEGQLSLSVWQLGALAEVILSDFPTGSQRNGSGIASLEVGGGVARTSVNLRGESVAGFAPVLWAAARFGFVRRLGGSFWVGAQISPWSDTGPNKLAINLTGIDVGFSAEVMP